MFRRVVVAAFLAVSCSTAVAQTVPTASAPSAPTAVTVESAPTGATGATGTSVEIANTPGQPIIIQVVDADDASTDQSSPSLWMLLLTSAGIASAVSAGAGFLNQHLERKARADEAERARASQIREAAMRLALEAAHERTRTVMAAAAADGRGRTVTLHDDVENAAKYYVQIVGILEQGLAASPKLPVS